MKVRVRVRCSAATGTAPSSSDSVVVYSVPLSGRVASSVPDSALTFR